MGRKAEALNSYSKAREFYAAIVSGNHQDVEGQLNLSATDTKVGVLRLQLGEADSASKILRGVIESLETLQSLSSEQVRYTLAEAYAGLGDATSYLAARQETCDRQISQWNEARSWYEKSVTVWYKLTSPGGVTPKGFAVCNPTQIRNRLKHSEAVVAGSRCRQHSSRLSGLVSPEGSGA